jgi:hypothetical protein
MEYMVIYKAAWGAYVLGSPKIYTFTEAKEFAKQINGLVIHKEFADCLDLM